MTTPSSYEKSLTEAENACLGLICDMLELRVGFDGVVSHNNGRPDCAVFNIGSLATPVLSAFPSPVMHFRARLDLFNRDRGLLQRWIMRLLREMPIGRNYLADHPLREDTIVSDFRIAPVQGNVSATSLTDVGSSTSPPVPTFTAAVLFDVVFVAREDAQDEDAPASAGGEEQGDTPQQGDDGGGGQHGPCPGGVTGGEGFPPLPT